MNDNFNNIDKSDFICLKFKDGSYYYGDIAYFDSQGSFVNSSQKQKFIFFKVSGKSKRRSKQCRRA